MPYIHGFQSTLPVRGATPTLTMVGCGDNHGVEEGLAWPIFAGRNSRKKTFNGSAVRWWLSSRNSPTYARYAIINGVAGYNYSSFTFGVVPAFVIPQSLQIDDTPYNDGSYRLTVLQNYHS